MTSWLRASSAVSGIAIGLTMFAPGASPTAEQNETYRAPRTRDGKPDLNGIWQTMNAAHWDIQGHAAQPGPSEYGALFSVPAGQGVVVGNTIPYQEWALEQRRTNFENRWELDPEAKCFLPGVPRATYMPFPFQIVQSTNVIMMIYEYASANRTIPLTPIPAAPADAWMGYSQGRWEGDTLVVEVTNFNGLTWFDRAGNFHSDGLHVTERYTPTDPNALSYEVTIEDPKVFTRTWQMQMPLYRRLEENVQLLEFKCVEFAEEYMYGHLVEPADESPERD